MEWILLIAFLVISFAFIAFTAMTLKSGKSAKSSNSHVEEQRREQFISIISHQLRTPLSIVRGYLEALASEDLGKLNDQQREYVNEAKTINKDMADLVNRYLEITSKGAHELIPDKHPIDMKQFLETIIKRHGTYAKASNIEFRSRLPKEEITVNTDEKILKQVLDNIIANAIKYTVQSGTVSVHVEKKDKRYIIGISDTGIGIPKEQHAEVFTKFFRAKNILHRSIAGSGLGLFIAKEYMTALGGDIWFTSEEGKGTTVFVSVPA